MANKYFKAILFFAFFLVTNSVLGQDLPPPPPGLPIDGGVLGLFVLGIGYAVKKIRDQSKK